MLPNDSKGLGARGTRTLRLQRGQKLAAASGEPRTQYLVSAGLVAIEIMPDAERRQILAFHRAGESFSLADYPALPGIRARAIVPTSLTWLATTVAEGDPGGATAAAQLRFAATSARLQTAILGRLTGEEKVATFLLEQVSLGPRPTGNEARIILSMTRRDIADYLGLNADTLSRVLSRLRQSSIISMSGRSEIRVRDLARLAAITPLSGAIDRIWSRSGRL